MQYRYLCIRLILISIHLWQLFIRTKFNFKRPDGTSIFLFMRV
jgi:hypothetical protein